MLSKRTPRAVWMTLAALALLGTGCASVSPQACRAGDWYALGLEDGRDGAPPERVERHAAGCAEQGVDLDREQYRAGRVDGLQHYCTSANGLRVGRQGYPYADACPGGREMEFLRGYQLGRQYHDLDRRLARIDADLQNYRLGLGQRDLSSEQRNRVEHLLRDLEAQRWRLESEYRRLDWELRQL